MEQSSGRPVKRPRLKGPDGFLVMKKPAYKSSPTFVSSFDAVPIPSTEDDQRDKPNNLAHVRSLRRQERPQIPFTTERPDFGDTSLGREAKGEEKASSVRPAEYHQRLEKSATLANNIEPERSRVPILKRPNIDPSKSASVHIAPLRQKPPSAPFRPLKPPSFVVSASVDAWSSTKPLSFSVLKPPPLPQPSTKAISLKPLAPPTFDPSFLKKPTTNMKAISSFATDPTKDGAGAELLSLFLQQHGHSFIPPLEREMQRGIGLSPRKNKDNKGKFKRGGLADRAQYLISCSKTDYTLWHRQLEQTLSSVSPAAPPPPYDMRFRILRVIPLPTKTSTPTSMHLAVCRISSRKKLASVGDLTDQCYAVLFPHLSGPSRNFEEGMDVLAWKPWFKVVIASVVPREALESLSVEPLMPPRSVVIAPRWHVMQEG
ncbi:hypothetical protein K503DRAFT_855135 [Rhizopogon vinicolor AM-OR11-026]|uniref:Uncharacterized protein n=1 Tax=Rhizopogon vinicolor AM-OR11-026 TaxID=1314800 RepID=A0A1B7N7D0_9AGAM|nr:hypothetical protein K503DRAFT_855135 [Rhizopogon vinicolor AM-OR11-026]